MTGKIFLNYRRADAEAWADRLFERLVRQFPRENVFMDIDGQIPFGFPWTDWLDTQVAACDLMVVLVGRTWVTEFNARMEPGTRDYVRFEIESAIRRKIPVVPVFLGDTPMPRAAELPDGIRPLLDNQAARLNRTSFDNDAETLVKGIVRSIALARQQTISSNASSVPNRVTTGAKHATSVTRSLVPRAQLATGAELRVRWNIPAVKVHFHRDGRFYQRPTSFPAALCDRYGYIIFKSDEELRGSSHLRVGKRRVNVKGDLWEVPGYVQTNDPVVLRPLLTSDRLSPSDLLARASREDSTINISSIAAALDPTTAFAIWRRFRAGQRGIMVRSIYTNDKRALFDEISARYKSDINLRRVVDRFLVDFEWLIRDIEQKDPAGLSTPERNCIGGPEQKSITASSKKAPDRGPSCFLSSILRRSFRGSVCSRSA